MKNSILAFNKRSFAIKPIELLLTHKDLQISTNKNNGGIGKKTT